MEVLKNIVAGAAAFSVVVLAGSVIFHYGDPIIFMIIAMGAVLCSVILLLCDDALKRSD